jgi:hypothetical protein
LILFPYRQLMNVQGMKLAKRKRKALRAQRLTVTQIHAGPKDKREKE